MLLYVSSHLTAHRLTLLTGLFGFLRQRHTLARLVVLVDYGVGQARLFANIGVEVLTLLLRFIGHYLRLAYQVSDPARRSVSVVCVAVEVRGYFFVPLGQL